MKKVKVKRVPETPVRLIDFLRWKDLRCYRNTLLKPDFTFLLRKSNL